MHRVWMVCLNSKIIWNYYLVTSLFMYIEVRNSIFYHPNSRNTRQPVFKLFNTNRLNTRSLYHSEKKKTPP